MRAVVVDIGNSQLRAVLWTGAEPERPAAVLATAGDGPTPLPELLRLATPYDRDEQRAAAASLNEAARVAAAEVTVITSVVPQADRALLAMLSGALYIDHTAPFPFGNAVDDPATVGADRYCNVAAATAAGLHDALIVDLGTATTFDLLRDGCFIGGLIAPGMAFAAAKLGETAARLAPVPFEPCPLRAGRDTAAAMRAGAYHVGRNGVLATVAALRRHYDELAVIVTGGLGGMLDQQEWPFDPDWTVRGAAGLAESIRSSG